MARKNDMKKGSGSADDMIEMIHEGCIAKIKAETQKILANVPDSELVGKIVKLDFKTGLKEMPSEHCWVKVTGITDEGFTGELNSHPAYFDWMVLGDRLVFKKEDIEEVYIKDGSS